MDILPTEIKIASYLVLGGLLARGNNSKVSIVCAVIIVLMDIWALVKKDRDDIYLSLMLTGLALILFLIGKCLQFN